MSSEKLYLKKNEERRLRAGHLWIFSNEIDTQKSPLKNFNPGQLVRVTSSSEKELGIAYINPQTLLCARLLTNSPLMKIDENFFAKRIHNALALRERIFKQPYYRLIYGEGDYIPGLIIDRYADTLVLQLNTAGIEQLQTFILSALQKILTPTRIILRNDTQARQLEGLADYSSVVMGDDGPLSIEENNSTFQAQALTGQKTGWFFDQRLNRTRFLNYVKGKNVLDTFCYVGAWGVQAAAAGAKEVHCVDSSTKALEWLKVNAEKNAVAEKIQLYDNDVFEQLQRFNQEKKKFDVIILDPPALIKKKKDLEQGTLAYQRLNELAMQLLLNDGILITCSCSLHLSLEMLINVVRKAGIKTGKKIQIIELGFQGPDHPVHPAIPETSYLKTLICRMTDER